MKLRTPAAVGAVLAVAWLLPVAGPGPAAVAGASVVTARGGQPAEPAPLPTPRPEAFDASGTVSVFPGPGTPDASPTTAITLRGPGAAALTSLDVTGSVSGPHPGRFQPDGDGGGTTFVPDSGFRPGERVTVHTSLAVRGAGADGGITFDVARPAPVKVPPGEVFPQSSKKFPGDSMHFVSRPDLQPPKLTVRTAATDTAPGDVFLTPTGGSGQHGPLVVDDEGQPVWFDPLTGASAVDLSVQQYRGQPVLTWFEGKVASPGYGTGDYVVADTSYHELTRVHAANGYGGDLHDFQITPQGTALFTIYNPVSVDASSVGGGRNRPVFDAIVQEVDIATGALRFEWHSLGSVALGESYLPVPRKAGLIYDYVHPNSVALDTDGNVLVSGRHTFAIYKIDRRSGVLDWRLGGKKGNFTLGTGAATAWQHDVRRAADGTVTIFDNGASGTTTTHKTSRGIVLDVDEKAMTANLRRSYEVSKPVLAKSQGSFQLLPNGDYLAGWGDQPEYTEFTPDGSVALDVRFPAGGPARVVNSYRAYRFPWSARAPGVPAAAAVRRPGDQLLVYASWNGATDVASWGVLAGPDLQHLAPLTTAPKHGFETVIHVTTNQPYVAVRALDASGTVLATSAPVTPKG
ncbi:MAG TPA: arylsulfotransferase family protein [Acidimicrobiia bacterium]|nr:arylsulfotransferase family protein [Acidimicrobiia bacterium]